MTDRAPPRALLAVPGDPDTPTGGYGYARAVLAASRGAGLDLAPLPLPGGFPEPDAAALAETARRLAAVPAGVAVVIDGLALGALPVESVRAVPGPVIALCHHPLGLETGLAPERAAALIAAETAALAACERVIATSRTTGALLSERLGVPAARLVVAEPGTEPAAPAVGGAQDGARGGGVALLAVGSLTPRKGHDVLIDALSRLGDLDWRLAVAGPDRDTAHAAELRARTAAAGLSERVRFLGALDRADLEAAYAGADLFVLASRYEGYGMAYTEAMARHLPVVGCASGAVPEATRGAACLVPPDDPDALAAALRPLIAEPAARARLARACAEAARTLPTWHDTAAVFARVVAALGTALDQPVSAP